MKVDQIKTELARELRRAGPALNASKVVGLVESLIDAAFDAKIAALKEEAEPEYSRQEAEHSRRFEASSLRDSGPQVSDQIEQSTEATASADSVAEDVKE